MSRTEYHQVDAPSLDGSGEVVVHGHWGRPVIWFPSEAGSRHDFATFGMLDAVRPAIDDGLITVFCVPSFDLWSWSDTRRPLGDRARQHRRYENWLVERVVPFVRDRCGGRDDIALAGPSMGAFHAVLLALRYPHLFPRAVGFSGNYDTWTWRSWGDRDDDTYFSNPMDFVPGSSGGHLDYLRERLRITLVVGSGSWEDTTGANVTTRRLAGELADKQIPHDLFVWGPEWPHDWSSWRAQAALYLPALG